MKRFLGILFAMILCLSCLPLPAGFPRAAAASGEDDLSGLYGVWEIPDIYNAKWKERYTFREDGTVTYLKYLNKSSSHELGQYLYKYKDGRIDIYAYADLDRSFVGGGAMVMYYENGKLWVPAEYSNSGKERKATRVKKGRTADMKKIVLARWKLPTWQENADQLLCDIGILDNRLVRTDINYGYSLMTRIVARSSILLSVEFTPIHPLDAALTFQVSDPEVLEVLAYNYYYVAIRGKKPGTATIRAEAADGSGVVSNELEITVAEGEPTLPAEYLGKAWHFPSVDETYFVFGPEGRYVYYTAAPDPNNQIRGYSGEYRYLDGMIQTDHTFFKNLFTYEEDGEYYLVSDTGNFQDSWAGTLYAEPLMTGEMQLGNSVFAFDDSGAPYPNPAYRANNPLWNSWEETMISPIE